MAPKENPLLNLHFDERPSPTSGKYKILGYKHCKWTSANTTQTLEHLENCTTYAAILKANEQLTKRQAILQLKVQTISREEKQKLDSAAALALYINPKPFRLCEDVNFRQLISLLFDNLYTPPHRGEIGGDLLNTQYDEVVGRVQSILAEHIVVGVKWAVL
jgi:hypothetical protein